MRLTFLFERIALFSQGPQLYFAVKTVNTPV